MEQFITTLFNGLSLSSIILLTSLGLAITFGQMKIINMAHGEFVMIGAYTTYVVQNVVAGIVPASMQGIYYIISIPAAFGVTFLLGSIMERLIVSRLYGREIDSLLATYGISLILQQAARSIFGTQGVNVNVPAFLEGGLKIGGCTFSYNRIFIITMVLVCLLIIYFIMYRSGFGKKMRAVMQNRPMAQCMGINSKRVDTITFSFGCTSWFHRFDSRSELYRKFIYGNCSWRSRKTGRNRTRLISNRILQYIY